MNIFNMTEIIAQQSQTVKDWISLFIFILIPLSVVIISAIIRIFCKKTLIVTGGIFTFFLLINLIFFRDLFLTLMSFLYYIFAFLGCFVTIVCEGILNLINKKRGRTDVDAYGRPKTYSSGALQGKKKKTSRNKKKS